MVAGGQDGGAAPARAERLDGFDALRGIAAFAVFLYHGARWTNANAYLAVDFFFMLSGYVMARSYEPGLSAPGAGEVFLRARVRRLWGVVALASLLGLPWVFHVAPLPLALIVTMTNLLLIPTFAMGHIYQLNPPAWSIGFELLANAIHAALICRLRGRVGALALVVVIVVYGVCAVRFSSFYAASGPEILWFGPIRVLAPYVIGICLYRCWRDVPPVRLPGWLTLAALPMWFWLVPALLASPRWSDLVFVFGLCPLLIAGGITCVRGSYWARRAGAISFPLYAVHGAVIMSMRGWGASPASQIAAALAAALLFERAMAGYHAWRRAMAPVRVRVAVIA